MRNLIVNVSIRVRYAYRVLKNKKFMTRCGVYLLFLISSVSLSFVVRSYVDSFTGYTVPDLILDHIPYIDMSFAFFQISSLFAISLILPAFFYPKSIPFTLAASATFFLIRTLFLILTHLSAPAIATYNYVEYEHGIRQILFSLQSGNDLFFSGHVGFPFLLALIFWNRKWLKEYFLVCTLGAVVIVLFGHLHYSIDVFSAFFIAYGIFKICGHIFKYEYALLLEEN